MKNKSIIKLTFFGLFSCSTMVYAMDHPLRTYLSDKPWTLTDVKETLSESEKKMEQIQVVLGNAGWAHSGIANLPYDYTFGMQLSEKVKKTITEVHLCKNVDTQNVDLLDCHFFANKNFGSFQRREPFYMILENRANLNDKLVITVERKVIPVITVDLDADVDVPLKIFHREQELFLPPDQLSDSIPCTDKDNCAELVYIREDCTVRSQIEVHLGNVKNIGRRRDGRWVYQLELYPLLQNNLTGAISYFVSSEHDVNIATEFNTNSLFSIITKINDQSVVFKVIGPKPIENVMSPIPVVLDSYDKFNAREGATKTQLSDKNNKWFSINFSMMAPYLAGGLAIVLSALLIIYKTDYASKLLFRRV